MRREFHHTADVVRRIPIDSSEPRDFIYPSRSSVQVFDKEERLVARKDRFDKYARMYPAQKSRESSIFIAKLYSRREQNCNFAISLPPCLGGLGGATLLKEVRWRWIGEVENSARHKVNVGDNKVLRRIDRFSNVQLQLARFSVSLCAPLSTFYGWGMINLPIYIY